MGIVVVNFVIYYLLLRNIIYLWLGKKNTFYCKVFIYKDIEDLKNEPDNILLEAVTKKISRYRIYKSATGELQKAGYAGKYKTIKYMCLLYGVPIIMFCLGWVVNFPDFQNALFCSLLIFVTIKIYIKGKAKKIALQFEKHAWRIYRYLRNQIEAGIKMTDAVTTVYVTINDKELRKILIKFTAVFRLTVDIEEALDEITACFGGNEAATLCMAIREGVKTGDSAGILKRQEDVMFNKYFNRLEADTEKSRTVCIITAAMFCIILVVMASVPILLDLMDAFGSIF